MRQPRQIQKSNCDHSCCYNQLNNMTHRFNDYINHGKLSHHRHQKTGVQWCIHNELCKNSIENIKGGFIVDEMGLGKTIMMTGLMYCNPLKQTLIILPINLVEQWYNIICKTMNLDKEKIIIITHANKKSISTQLIINATIVITTYTYIRITKNNTKTKTLLHPIKWSRIICDEAHHLRNKNAMFKGVKQLSSNIRWLVSGTPIQNNINNYYNLCDVLNIPKPLYTNLKNIKIISANFILRRTKKEVGITISDLTITQVTVKWSNKHEHKLAKDFHSIFKNIHKKDKCTFEFPSIINQLKQIKGGHLVALLKSKQLCIMPRLIESFVKKTISNLKSKGIAPNNTLTNYLEGLKFTSKLDNIVKDILKRKLNNCKKLIFCQFREEINEIYKRLTTNDNTINIDIYDGRVSQEQRNEILHKENDILILQIQASCEGLNLQQYCEVYFVSPHWNPFIEEQAIARCHRIGQTQNVQVFKYSMENFHNNLTSNIIKDTTITQDEIKKYKETNSLDAYTKNIHDAKYKLISQIY